MPKRGGGDDGVSFGKCMLVERVKRSVTIASKNHGPGWKGLHRKTKGIKFNRTIIISGKLTNGYEIFDNVGNYENISKMERF